MSVCEARERRQTTFARLGLKRGDSFLPCCTGHVSGHWGRPEASGICRAAQSCLAACGQRAPLPSVTAFVFSHTRADPVTGVLDCWGLKLNSGQDGEASGLVTRRIRLALASGGGADAVSVCMRPGRLAGPGRKERKGPP
jgi:hypothetical protein